MGLAGRKAQDEPSTGVILFDDPALRNRNGSRIKLSDGAPAGDVRDSEARLQASAIVAPGDPGAHRHPGATAAEQREEPERGGGFVIVAEPGDQVDPSVAGVGQLLHGRDDLCEVVAGEVHSLGLTRLARHAGSIAVDSAPAGPAATGESGAVGL